MNHKFLNIFNTYYSLREIFPDAAWIMYCNRDESLDNIVNGNKSVQHLVSSSEALLYWHLQQVADVSVDP